MKTGKTAIDKIMTRLCEAVTLLEPQAASQIVDFIRQNQKPSGGFCDRSGREDLYYCFFGFLLCKSFGLTKELLSLRNFTRTSAIPQKSQNLERLIQIFLSHEQAPGLIKILRLILAASKETAAVYSAFIGLLILDSLCKLPGIVWTIAGLFTPLFLKKKELPAPHLAAGLFIRSRARLPAKKIASRLMNYNISTGGFCAFNGGTKADLLSTAVCLFALSESAADLRLIAPACLDFITSNFDHGAFLSGDGDKTRDLEYTVYGLLALSSVSASINKD
jgi:hypothetical protein